MIGFACIGEHSRSSNFNVNGEQQIRLSIILDNFKDMLKEIGLNYTSIEIKVLKEVELSREEARKLLKITLEELKNE